jgi:hypothetical protein
LKLGVYVIAAMPEGRLGEWKDTLFNEIELCGWFGGQTCDEKASKPIDYLEVVIINLR